MEEQDILTLIDQYLLGTIRKEDKATLEQLMAADASIAAMVSESMEAFKVLQHARNQQLKEKLRKLDKDDMHRQRFMFRRIGLVAFCLACILVWSYLVSFYFSSSAVARRNFMDYSKAPTSASGQDEVMREWRHAKDAFLQEDFQKAIQLYQVLSEQGSPTEIYTARWNMLLSQLALDGVTPGWQMSLEVFAREAPEPFASKANKLSGMMNSGFRKVFIMQLREDHSILKPGFI